MLHDGPFYFEEQPAAALTNGPLELKNGDLITTPCSFEHNTNRTVTLGENTGNETCFNFSWHYPRSALSCTQP